MHCQHYEVVCGKNGEEKEADTVKKLEEKLDKVKGIEIKEEWEGIVEWMMNWSKRKEKDWATWKKKKSYEGKIIWRRKEKKRQ